MNAIDEARRLDSRGELHPGLRSLLHRHRPRWRQNQTAWWSNHDAYRDWCAAHNGQAPDTFDDGAAGLRPWILSQDDSQLTARQRTALHTLPGWRGTIGNPAAARHWGIVTAMHNAGISPARRDDHKSIDEQVTAAMEAYADDVEFASAASTSFTANSDPEQGKALTYALFRARNLREPIAIEPSGNWVRKARSDGGPAARRAISLINGAPTS